MSSMRKIKSSYGCDPTAPKIPRIEVRRSSSLHFPIEKPLVFDSTKLSDNSGFHSNSYISVSPARSELSLMPRSGFCFCCRRLKVASCIIGAVCIGLSVISMCSLLTISGGMSRSLQDSLALPLSAVLLFQTASAIILIIGVLIENHFFLLPFMLNSILHVILGICVSTALIIFCAEWSSPFLPLFLIISLVASAVYLWFVLVTGMTYLQIRNKKILGWESVDDLEVSRAMERVNSSMI